MRKQHILVADDDRDVRELLARVLRKAGHDVFLTEDAEGAVKALACQTFDVVISDIVMPGLTGIELLRETRRRDLDVPVILVTGTPTLDTAIAAVELGAFRYLIKPFDMAYLTASVERAASLHRLALAKREALDLLGDEEHLLGDKVSLEARFESACSSLWMAFQPIVSHRGRAIVGFEALLRTEEFTLRSPLAFVGAAERLGRLHDLGRRVRAAAAIAIADAPSSVELFVNLHAFDIADDELASADSPLSKHAHRVVLELTERAPLDHIKDAKSRISALRKLGFKIAIDDLGAGYAGLNCITTFEPEVVKIDMTLVRGVDADVKRQRVIGSLLELCRELDIRVVVEGVETAAERDMVVLLGGDIIQGYHYARPARGFTSVSESAWGCTARPPPRSRAQSSAWAYPDGLIAKSLP